MKVNNLLFQEYEEGVFKCFTCGKDTYTAIELYKSGGKPVIFPVCRKCQKQATTSKKQEMINEYLNG